MTDQPEGTTLFWSAIAALDDGEHIRDPKKSQLFIGVVETLSEEALVAAMGGIQAVAEVHERVATSRNGQDGWLRSFQLVGGAVTDERDWGVGNVGKVLSFGQDDSGELYLLSANGNIYSLIETR